MCAADSYQFQVLARKTLSPILRWWHTNGIPTFSHPPHRELIAALGFDEDAHNKTTRRVFFDAMLAAFYHAVELYLREFCTAKGAFTLRVVIGDLATRNILNLNKAQLSKKESRGNVTATVTPAAKADALHAGGPRQADGAVTGKKNKQKGICLIQT